RNEGRRKQEKGSEVRNEASCTLPPCPLLSASRSGEPVQREPLQLFPYRLQLDVLQHAGGEGVGEQLARGVLANAATLHVEERGVVQATHRGAVRALDVVGVDLELRLGVHPRLARQEQV